MLKIQSSIVVTTLFFLSIVSVFVCSIPASFNLCYKGNTLFSLFCSITNIYDFSMLSLIISIPYFI
jgi:hypothetical protein